MLPKANTYQFYGSPVSQAAAVAAHRADRDAQSQVAAAREAAQGQAGAARQSAIGNLYSQPTDAYQAYAGASANAASGYQQGLGAMAGAQGGLFQNYNTALANLFGSQMSGMGTAEAARQIGLANLGSSALSAGGQASGAAMGAWQANQSAFAKAMADAAAANQMALAQYGAGRDSALASLGNSVSNYGTGLNRAWTDAQAGMNNYSRDLNKLGVARDLGIGQLGVAGQVAGNMPATMSGLGEAIGGIGNSISGAIAQFAGGDAPEPTPSSPSHSRPYPTAPAARLPGYGWRPYQYSDQPGNLALTGLARGADTTFGELSAARKGVQDSSVLDSLNLGSAAARNQLDSAYYSSRNMPSRMLSQSLAGFDSMMRTAGRGLNYGMNQFYANMPRGYAEMMREGTQAGAAALRDTAGKMGAAYSNMSGQLRDQYSQLDSRYGSLLDRTGLMSDLSRQRQQAAMRDEAAARRMGIPASAYRVGSS